MATLATQLFKHALFHILQKVMENIHTFQKVQNHSRQELNVWFNNTCSPEIKPLDSPKTRLRLPDGQAHLFDGLPLAHVTFDCCHKFFHTCCVKRKLSHGFAFFVCLGLFFEASTALLKQLRNCYRIGLNLSLIHI